MLDLSLDDRSSLQDRMKKRTEIDQQTGCWIWKGATAGLGYGTINIKGKMFYLHRLSGWVFLGFSLEDKLTQINHKRKCNRAACWNPDHLYVGDQQENVHDWLSLEKRKGQTHCHKGHEFTKENTYWSCGRRSCKTCSREKYNRLKAKKEWRVEK